MPTSTVTEVMNTAIRLMCIDVFGKGWKEFQIAHLSTTDVIGIELFSFSNGVKAAPPFNSSVQSQFNLLIYSFLKALFLSLPYSIQVLIFFSLFV